MSRAKRERKLLALLLACALLAWGTAALAAGQGCRTETGYAAVQLAAADLLEDCFRQVRTYKEELGIPLIQERRHNNADMCANVDMYSGLVYTMLDIPEDVFTPLFASARIAGWCANRIEELVTCRRIMRPAYRAVTTHGQYIPMEQRTPHIQ